MYDHEALYKVLDSHFNGHLVRDAEDREREDADAPLPDMPDVMLDDLIDELDETLEELHDQFAEVPNAPVAVSYGFIDGVLAQADGSYTTYEDAYVADAKNDAYAQLDQAIDAFSKEFDGNRDWSEAAKGYMRSTVKEDDPERGIGDAFWQAQAAGFIYGADLSEDYEWKVMQDSSGNVIVTDEDAIEEYSNRQLAEKGFGGLFDKISNMLGIDLGELETALEDAVENEKSDKVEGDDAVIEVSAEPQPAEPQPAEPQR